MFKVVLFACLCVAVLAVNAKPPPGQRRANSPNRSQNNLNRPQNNANRPQNNQNRAQNNLNRSQNGSNRSLKRPTRQLPSMPGMNPAEIPKLMADGVQKGIGVMGNMMDPSKWMQAASQMIPKSNDSQ